VSLPPALFPERLARWAAERAARPALLFLEQGEHAGGSLDFATLHRRAAGIGAALAARGTNGRPVLVLARHPLHFAAAVLGCLAAGAVAVPCSAGTRGRGLDRVAAIAADCAPAAVLVDQGAADIPVRLGGADIPVLRIEDCDGAALARPVRGGADAPALLQYTSGSTAAPKGVVVTARNLAANLAMLEAAFAVDADSVYLTWLPLFHDMGLIGNLLAALWAGVPCILMSPLAFYQKPQRWLAAIGRYGATISGGPNFAYDLCLRRRGAMALGGVDLGRWRLAFCGAEPVRARTMRGFAAAFAAVGFDARALYPCYGLAEATVFVTGSRPGGGIRTAPDRGGAEIVGCGRAPPGAEVAIVDPETRRVVPDGTIGEVWVRGDHVAAGYWDRPDLTDATFRARPAPDDGRRFLRTGDLGWLDEGELYLKSRLKDLIIWQGGNIHPEDIEATCAQAHPAFAGAGAAFAVEAADSEAVVVVQELAPAPGRTVDAAAALHALTAAVAAAHGVYLSDALLVPPGTMPRTTSGKVQRGACRALYAAGALSASAVAGLQPPRARQG
jgi:acyl-CoA synthetase (AMP-forming)/AMP-acid ligase II